MKELDSLFSVNKFIQRSKGENKFTKLFGNPDSYQLSKKGNKISLCTSEGDKLTKARVLTYYKEQNVGRLWFKFSNEYANVSFLREDCPELYQILEEIELYFKLNNIKY